MRNSALFTRHCEDLKQPMVVVLPSYDTAANENAQVLVVWGRVTQPLGTQGSYR